MKEKIESECHQQSIDNVKMLEGQLIIEGSIGGQAACESTFSLAFEELQTGHMQFKLKFANPKINYSQLTSASTADERFYGFGEHGFGVLDNRRVILGSF